MAVQSQARGWLTRARRPGAVAAVLLPSLLVFTGLTGCGGEGSTSNAKVGQSTLQTKSVKAGDVEVAVSPKRVTTRTASLMIVLDTHAGDLGVALPESTTLTVGGSEWPAADFEGDGPGGHHREGTLHFRASGPLEGVMRLTISGLSEPVVLSWTVAR